MAVREIKTSIELDGEKQFEAELRSIAKELRVNDSEMKALRSSYDLTDNKMANMSRQSQVAKEKLETQKNVVAALSRELEQAKSKYGDTSPKVQDLAIKLNTATDKMNLMTKESQALDRNLEELGRDAAKVGKQITDGISGSVKGTSDDMQSMYSSMSESLNSIMQTGKVRMAFDISEKVFDVIGSIGEFGESYRDYNRTMSFLDNAAYNNHYDADFIRKLYIQASSVTGDTEGTIEGLNNLMRLGYSETDLTKAVYGLLGASVLMPDTFKFESLAQGMRESYQNGAATGQYAEMLENMGVDLEEFGTAMTAAETDIGKQQVALAYLTGEMTEAGRSYIDRNSDLIAAEESTMELEAAKAALARNVDYLAVPWRKLQTEYIDLANGVLTGEIGLGAGIGKALDMTFGIAKTSPGDLADALAHPETNVMGAYVTEMTESEYALMLARLATEGASKEVTKSTGKQAATDYATGMQEGLGDAGDTLESAGLAGATDLTAGLAQGVASGSDEVIGEIELLVEQINNELSKVNDIDIGVKTSGGGSSAAGGAAAGMSAVVNLDGRKVGALIAPYVNRDLGGILRDR